MICLLDTTGPAGLDTAPERATDGITAGDKATVKRTAIDARRYVVRRRFAREMQH
jgi:hypothetical protein